METTAKMKAPKPMRIITNEMSLADLIALCQARLDNVFSAYLAEIPSLELKQAMQHSLLNGGKRLRPLLVYATGCIFDASWDNLDAPATAVEMIHTYSLIHDDLPCMDDASTRRGKPSCHKVYGEAMAVLAGDALLTLAMEVLATPHAGIKADRRIQMINVLSKASGAAGMVGGQAMDITMMDDPGISTDLLSTIYHLKTGALFTACIELGRLASNDDDEVNQRALKHFGDCIGYAFQIQDDVLDIETSSEELGKQQGMDSKNQKITYVRLHGLVAAKEKVQSLYQEGLEAINYLGTRANLLRELIGFMLARKA